MEDRIQCKTAFIVSPRIKIVLSSHKGSTLVLTSDITWVENQPVLVIKQDRNPHLLMELLTDHGVEYVIMLVAGRSLNEKLSYTWWAVRDHINWTGNNPLRGPNNNRGPRFPDMSSPYLIKDPDKGIVSVGVNDLLFISPAEMRMMAALGADCMTDELVHTNIILNHAGIPCQAFVTQTEHALEEEDLANFIRQNITS